MKDFDSHGRPLSQRWQVTLLIPMALWGLIGGIWLIWVPGHVSPLKLPDPRAVIQSAERMGAEFFSHTWWSFLRAVTGLMVGGLAGFLVGVAMFASRCVHSLFWTLIEVIRPAPLLGLTIFFLLWFQLHPIGPIMLVGLGAFLIMTLSTEAALRQVPLHLRRAASSSGIRGFVLFYNVLIPSALPRLEAPIRLSVASSVAAVTAAELLGQQQGWGFVLVTARRNLSTETILLAIIMLGLLSVTMDTVVRLAFKKLVNWPS